MAIKKRGNALFTTTDVMAGLVNYAIEDNVKVERLKNGIIHISADVEGMLKPAAIKKVTSVASGTENEIVVKDKNDGRFNDSLIVEGDNLLWDDSQPDEGFFINLMGIETKMTVETQDPKGKRVVVKNERQAANVGDTFELWFYYRRTIPLNGGSSESTLLTKDCGELTCVKAEVEPQG